MQRDVARYGTKWKKYPPPWDHPPSLGPNGPVRREVRSGKWEVGKRELSGPFPCKALIPAILGKGLGFGT